MKEEKYEAKLYYARRKIKLLNGYIYRIFGAYGMALVLTMSLIKFRLQKYEEDKNLSDCDKKMKEFLEKTLKIFEDAYNEMKKVYDDYESLFSEEWGGKMANKEAIDVILREVEDLIVEVNEFRFKVSRALNSLKFVLLEMKKQESDSNGKSWTFKWKN